MYTLIRLDSQIQTNRRLARRARLLILLTLWTPARQLPEIRVSP